MIVLNDAQWLCIGLSPLRPVVADPDQALGPAVEPAMILGARLPARVPWRRTPC